MHLQLWRQRGRRDKILTSKTNRIWQRMSMEEWVRRPICHKPPEANTIKRYITKLSRKEERTIQWNFKTGKWKWRHSENYATWKDKTSFDWCQAKDICSYFRSNTRQGEGFSWLSPNVLHGFPLSEINLAVGSSGQHFFYLVF